jgi:hypothetical protein
MDEQPEQPPQPEQPFAQPPPAADYSGHYPRYEAAAYGTPERLQALADGYFGLNWVFLLNVVMAISTRAIPAVAPDADLALPLLLGAYGAIFLVVAFATFPFNRKIATGKGWDTSAAVLASFLMGLNSALCCGIIGYVVMQSIAAGEMKRYGLKSGFFGLRKADVERRIAELRQAPPPTTGFQV